MKKFTAFLVAFVCLASFALAQRGGNTDDPAKKKKERGSTVDPLNPGGGRQQPTRPAPAPTPTPQQPRRGADPVPTPQQPRRGAEPTPQQPRRNADPVPSRGGQDPTNGGRNAGGVVRPQTNPPANPPANNGRGSVDQPRREGAPANNGRGGSGDAGRNANPWDSGRGTQPRNDGAGNSPTRGSTGTNPQPSNPAPSDPGRPSRGGLGANGVGRGANDPAPSRGQNPLNNGRGANGAPSGNATPSNGVPSTNDPSRSGAAGNDRRSGAATDTPRRNDAPYRRPRTTPNEGRGANPSGGNSVGGNTAGGNSQGATNGASNGAGSGAAQGATAQPAGQPTRGGVNREDPRTGRGNRGGTLPSGRSTAPAMPSRGDAAANPANGAPSRGSAGTAAAPANGTSTNQPGGRSAGGATRPGRGGVATDGLRPSYGGRSSTAGGNAAAGNAAGGNAPSDRPERGSVGSANPRGRDTTGADPLADGDRRSRADRNYDLGGRNGSRGTVTGGRPARGAEPASNVSSGVQPGRLRPAPVADRRDDRRRDRDYDRYDDDRYERHRHRHSSTTVSVGLFVGGGGSAFSLGYAHSSATYCSYESVTYGYGGGAWYSTSVYHSAAYDPCWGYAYYGYAAPSAVVVSPYGVTYYQPPAAYIAFEHSRRFHFGLAYYYPFAVYTPYPFYRVSYYEPYYMSTYAVSYPVYRTYYYTSAPAPVTVSVEASDPYVEQEVVVQTSEISAPVAKDPAEWTVPAPEPAEAPATAAAGTPAASAAQAGEQKLVPMKDINLASIDAMAADPTLEGKEYDDCLAIGEDALFRSDYRRAARAFYQAAKVNDADADAKLMLGFALFGAEEFADAARTLDIGFAQSSESLSGQFELPRAFASDQEFQSHVKALERYLVKNPGDRGAEAVLAVVYFFSGNYFGAANVVSNMQVDGQVPAYLQRLSSESMTRLEKN